MFLFSVNEAVLFFWNDYDDDAYGNDDYGDGDDDTYIKPSEYIFYIKVSLEKFFLIIIYLTISPSYVLIS